VHEEYLASEALSSPGQAPSSTPVPSLTAAGEGPQAPASAQVQAAVQAAVQDGGGKIPAIAGVTAGVLLAGALAAYLVARRKNRTGSTDSVV
jgi:predicted membrane protein